MMNANPLFSVIIPHKNRQEMLVRCLESIPRRDDVQIIVVDDNSDPNLVDFENFPGLNDNHIEVYFTKEGKGAGYARNVGLEHAKGKWVLFADSDDWYLDNLSEMMDRYVDSDSDMLVFRQKRVDANGIEKDCYYDKMFDAAITTGELKEIIYYYACPIARFIRRNIIKQNNIKFQQVRYSNDVMFSLKVSLAAKQIKVINEQIYCVFESNNSLRRNSNWRNYYVRTKVAFDVCAYLKSIGNKYDYSHILWAWYHKLIMSNKMVALYLFPKLCCTIGIKRVKLLVGDSLKKDYPKYFNK
ncbi:MAG: glycosyltransferase family 2 protein [Bacteroidales bacterium]|nr:glycosyltransferase family 2 protein [Bacteroidales bacterium]